MNDTAAEALERMRVTYESIHGPGACPESVRESIDRYVSHGIEPGGFVTAVLANDLMMAFRRVDVFNVRAMAAIVSYVYNDIPSPAHGSYAAVEAWMVAVREARRLDAEVAP